MFTYHSAGYTVQLYDTNNAALQRGFETTQTKILSHFKKQSKDHLAGEVMDRLHIAKTLEDAVVGAGLIVEAVKEDR